MPPGCGRGARLTIGGSNAGGDRSQSAEPGGRDDVAVRGRGDGVLRHVLPAGERDGDGDDGDADEHDVAAGDGDDGTIRNAGINPRGSYR